jgi:membrane protein
VLGAIAAAQILPQIADRRAGGLVGDIAARILGWGLSAVLVAVAIALLLRFAPATQQPFRLVGTATVFVVVSWAIASTLFGIYATQLAAYGTVFGGLAFAIILMTYIYVSALTFLAGLQVDAHVHGLGEKRRKGHD